MFYRLYRGMDSLPSHVVASMISARPVPYCMIHPDERYEVFRYSASVIGTNKRELCEPLMRPDNMISMFRVLFDQPKDDILFFQVPTPTPPNFA